MKFAFARQYLGGVLKNQALLVAGCLFLTGLRFPVMAAPKIAPYGSWRSPITTQMLVEKSVRIGDTSMDDGKLFWVESRPEDGGRYVIVTRSDDGVLQDVLPAPYSARTLVHEYGGGAILASAGRVYFSNFTDQRIWSVAPGEDPKPVTAESSMRFADFVHDKTSRRLICVCEDHGRGEEPVNSIVAVSLDDGAVTTLTSSADFYASPRIDPKGGRLAWLSWNHPNMPWDGVQLHVAPFESDGRLGQARLAAGGENESIFQPEWSPDGVLYFVSDRTNWWNLYRLTDRGVEAIAPMEAEFGLPQWVFGLTTYGFAADGSIIAIYTTSGVWKMLRIQPDSKQTEEIPLPYNNLSGLRVGERKATLLAGSPTQGQTLVEVDWSMGAVQAIRQASPVTVDLEYVSIPETIEFPTDGGKTGHAFYYPPKNRDFVGPEGEAPPLIIIVHGGPTSASRARFDLSIQFWTTRGFGVCDVNYGGSTGYGREYRNRLRKAWGIVDVADAANAALYLAEQKKADRNKLVIRGGSAGGYTTLACLAFRDVFRCGASYFGISDLALMASDTHKFESRYLDGLIGRYPEEEHIYQQRSPIHHLEGFNQPVLLLQGLEDKVVPPNQAEAIFDALKTKGIPVAYVPFEGEQHGFRKAETIIRAHEAELYFYSRILGFSLPEPIEPIEILNLP